MTQFKYRPPDVGQLIPGDSFSIIITSVDHAKMEGTFKLFEDKIEAVNWIHDSSVRTNPEWHEQQCGLCMHKRTARIPRG